MDNTTIRITSGKLFPFQFQFFAILLIIFSALLPIQNPYLVPLPLIPGLIIITGYYGVEICPKKKEYRVFNSFLLIKTGSWTAFDSIDNIFINSSYQTQKVYLRVTEGPTIRKKLYNAFLKFNDGTKVFLKSHKSRKALIEKLQKFSDHLELEIKDQTD